MSRRRKNPILQRFEYAVYRSVSAFAARLSADAALRWGTRLGSLSSIVLRGRNALAVRNLTVTFPEKSPKEIRAIAKECWRHFGREVLQYIRVQRASFDEMRSRFESAGSSLIEESIARGHGTILISAHFGSWEVGGLAIMSFIKNVRTVARALDNELLERDLARIRSKTGAEVIDRRHAARPLMKALAENALVVLLPDQAVQPREGILVPFLGRPAWTTPAPAKLALRHGSTIVFAFCIPAKNGHRLEFQEQIRVDQLTEEERDPAALTARINDVISRRIASRPELWLWMHDRWKGTGESGTADGK
jgi:Kdo2-lipid IVA lauroyltransferase/acyltransferase